jgi:delta24-sterol reductase
MPSSLVCSRLRAVRTVANTKLSAISTPRVPASSSTPKLVLTKRTLTTNHPMSSSNPVLDSHNKDIQKVAAAVKRSYTEKRPFRIYHGHTNSTRQNVLKKNESIDVSMLDRIISFDLAKKTVFVEPNVAMDSLVQATLKYGLVPAVVPEFPGITVGGAYAGTAGESSSFKWGFFDRLVRRVEVVLGNGKVVEASEEREQELFERLPSTMGTLGVVTACEVQLIPAKRFVEVRYVRVGGMEEATKLIKENLGNEELDFLDGIMFSSEAGAVVMGKLTDSIPDGRRAQRFSRAWDPWYYMHVQSCIETASKTDTDFIPIADYLFRYDRGGFWVGRSAFKYMHFPFNRLTRWFLDDFLHTRMLYRALHASKNVIGYVVQDLALPYETAPQFIAFTNKEFQIYPLWLCPLKESPEGIGKESFHPWLSENPSSSTETKTIMKPMLNIGLWGLPPPTARSHADYVRLNQSLEETLHKLHGLKWLYSRTYYTAEQFWTYYPKGWYDALRKKYRAEHLPDVWQKVHVDVVKETREMQGWKARVLRIWPVAGLYGCWKGMWSGEWKVARKVRIGEMDVVQGKGKKEA